MDKITKKKKGRPLTIYIENEMVAVLKRQAASRKCTVSQLVRDCLYKFNDGLKI